MTDSGASKGTAKDTAGRSRLAENIMSFARTLRAAGLPIGPGKVIDAVEAVKAAGIGDREDFYWTLHAVFVHRRDQREIFDQAFHIFWRNPEFLKRMMAMLLPSLRYDNPGEDQDEIATRLAEALQGPPAADGGGAEEADEEEIRIDAALTFPTASCCRRWISRRCLGRAGEGEDGDRHPAPAAHGRADAALPPSARGPRVDMRATLRASLKNAGAIPLKLKRPSSATRRWSCSATSPAR